MEPIRVEHDAIGGQTLSETATKNPSMSVSAEKRGLVSPAGTFHPELDALRAMAVGAVIVHHYLAKDVLINRAMEWGWLGVRAFFVLSGFLITRLLLQARIRTEAGATPRSEFRTFLVRRALRIFPLYFGYLGFLLWFRVGVQNQEFDPDFYFFLVYAQNFAMNAQETIAILPFAGHLWSLAVEEQFYVVWPFVILFVPTRHLERAVWLAILVGPLSRLSLLIADTPAATAMLLTPSNFDTLGMGCLLAVWVSPFARTRRAVATISLRLAGAAGFLALCAYAYLKLGTGGFSRLGAKPGSQPTFVFLDFFAACFFAFVIYALATQSYPKFLRPLFLNKALMKLGTISYALYVFHPIMPALIRFVGRRVQLDNSTLLLVVAVGVTIQVSLLSWRFFEGPINGLKDKLAPYSRTADTPYAAGESGQPKQ